MSHTTITLDAETAVDTLENIRRRLEKRRLEGTGSPPSTGPRSTDPR